MRRVLVIGAIVIVGLGLIGALYFYFASRGGELIVGGGDLFGSAEDRDGLGVVDIGTNVPMQGAGEIFGAKLIKITDEPVAKGAVAVYIPPTRTSAVATTTASSTTESVVEPINNTTAEVMVRYIDRQSGNVYAFQVHGRVLTRLSNKTLPGVQEAAWLSDGTRAFVRFLETDAESGERVGTYLLPASGEGGYFLEQGLDQVLVQGTSTLVTLLENAGGSTATIATVEGANPRTLFSSTLSAIRLAFSGNNFIATTKASSQLDGYAFLVDRASGSFTRLIGPGRGLATLPSPSGSSILYSFVDRGKLYLQVFDTAGNTTTPLPLATLVEKCAWSADSRTIYCAVPIALAGNLPDDWYQGARLFADRLWEIDLETRVATLLADPAQLADVQVDGVALTVDRASDVLVFMNKRDGSLWAYDL